MVKIDPMHEYVFQNLITYPNYLVIIQVHYQS
jgi:hypothetical protein